MIIDQSLRLRFKKVLSRHCNPNELEDAVQEAMLHAWDMTSTGETDERIIFVKSIVRGRRVASPNESGQPSGKPVAERKGYTTTKGQETKQRIAAFTETYQTQHGKPPTLRETAKAVGLSLGTITHHRKLNNVSSLKEIKQISESATASFDEVSEQFVASSFNVENKVISHFNFVDLLNVLNPEEREILFLKHHEDLTLEQLANATGTSVKTVHTKLKFAHNKVKESLT